MTGLRSFVTQTQACQLKLHRDSVRSEHSQCARRQAAEGGLPCSRPQPTGGQASNAWPLCLPADFMQVDLTSGLTVDALDAPDPPLVRVCYVHDANAAHLSLPESRDFPDFLHHSPGP